MNYFKKKKIEIENEPIKFFNNYYITQINLCYIKWYLEFSNDFNHQNSILNILLIYICQWLYLEHKKKFKKKINYLNKNKLKKLIFNEDLI